MTANGEPSLSFRWSRKVNSHLVKELSVAIDLAIDRSRA